MSPLAQRLFSTQHHRESVAFRERHQACVRRRVAARLALLQRQSIFYNLFKFLKFAHFLEF